MHSLNGKMLHFIANTNEIASEGTFFNTHSLSFCKPTSTAASNHSSIALDNWPCDCVTFMTGINLWKLQHEDLNQPVLGASSHIPLQMYVILHVPCYVSINYECHIILYVI